MKSCPTIFRRFCPSRTLETLAILSDSRVTHSYYAMFVNFVESETILFEHASAACSIRRSPVSTTTRKARGRRRSPLYKHIPSLPNLHARIEPSPSHHLLPQLPCMISSPSRRSYFATQSSQSSEENVSTRRKKGITLTRARAVQGGDETCLMLRKGAAQLASGRPPIFRHLCPFWTSACYRDDVETQTKTFRDHT